MSDDGLGECVTVPLEHPSKSKCEEFAYMSQCFTGEVNANMPRCSSAVEHIDFLFRRVFSRNVNGHRLLRRTAYRLNISPLDCVRDNVIFHLIKRIISSPHLLTAFTLDLRFKRWRPTPESPMRACQLLSGMLRLNTYLITLNLISCNINDRCVVSLADGIGHNTTLRDLSLEDNEITNKGFIPLIESICTRNRSLSYLNMDSTNLSDLDPLCNPSEMLDKLVLRNIKARRVPLYMSVNATLFLSDEVGSVINVKSRKRHNKVENSLGTFHSLIQSNVELLPRDIYLRQQGGHHRVDKPYKLLDTLFERASYDEEEASAMRVLRIHGLTVRRLPPSILYFKNLRKLSIINCNLIN